MFVLFVRGPAGSRLPINVLRAAIAGCVHAMRACSGLQRIPKRYEHCELSNFEFDGAHCGLASARMAACRFVEEYPLETSGLLLVGSIGVSKTHLAVEIIKELILGKGFACLFCDYRELLKQIQTLQRLRTNYESLRCCAPSSMPKFWFLMNSGPPSQPNGWATRLA